MRTFVKVEELYFLKRNYAPFVLENDIYAIKYSWIQISILHKYTMGRKRSLFSFWRNVSFLRVPGGVAESVRN